MISHSDFLERYCTVLNSIVQKYTESRILDGKRIQVLIGLNTLQIRFIENEFVIDRGPTSGCLLWDENHANWHRTIFFPNGANSIFDTNTVVSLVMKAILDWSCFTSGVK